MITVSMPVGELDGDLLIRAVNSVLLQTFDDIHLVVVADGSPDYLEPISAINDSRLIRHTLSKPMGRYFIDALVVSLAPTEFWTPHDADDWSEADRYEGLIPYGVDVLWESLWYHPVDKEPYIRYPKPVKNELLYFAHHNAGLYRVEAVKAVGGPHPQFKGSGDTLMMSLLETMFGSTVIDRPKFHHVKRRGSLSKSEETGLGTEWRKGQQRLQRRVWAKKIEQDPSEWRKHPNVSREVKVALAEEREKLGQVFG